MLTRRVALSLAALTALATLPVLSGAAPAGASGAVLTPSPMARGNDDGDPEGPDSSRQEEQNNCPTEMWTIPLEIKGLACILLLPKPDQEDQDGEDSRRGGLGDLLG